MPGHDGAGVHVAIVFWDEVHVVEDHALEVVHLQRFLEGRVHDTPFVERQVPVLLTHKHNNADVDKLQLCFRLFKFSLFLRNQKSYMLSAPLQSVFVRLLLLLLLFLLMMFLLLLLKVESTSA